MNAIAQIRSAAVAEYLEGNGENKQASHHKTVTAAASKAFQDAVVDLRLDHGAVRLFVLLTEFSWWYDEGGDGRGGITVSVTKLVRHIGANRHFVIDWIRQLLRFDYIWRDKIPQRSGYDASKYFITCLVPKVTQRELPLSAISDTLPGATNGTTSGATNGTTSGATNGTGPSATSGTLKEVKEVKEVRGSHTPPSGSGQGDIEDDPTGFKKWRADLNKLFPREMERKLDLLRGDLKKFNGNGSHYKRGPMRPELLEFVEMAREQLPKLERSKKPEDKKRAIHYRQKISEIEQAEDSYVRGPLLPGPAAVKANIVRKIEALEQALR